uniref:CMP/dCMP-type deaminase domain-containing protein n=1 Tax=Panagrellus redivivus TaxID=6233 RepID=A0A7E4VZE7_PANRE
MAKVKNMEEGALVRPCSAFDVMGNAYLAASSKDRLLVQQKAEPLLRCSSCHMTLLTVPEIIAHDCKSNQKKRVILSYAPVFMDNLNRALLRIDETRDAKDSLLKAECLGTAK